MKLLLKVPAFKLEANILNRLLTKKVNWQTFIQKLTLNDFNLWKKIFNFGLMSMIKFNC